MIRIAAKVVSYMFHPIFMPVYGILIYLNSGTYLEYLPFEARRAIFLIILLTTLVIPLSLLPMFLYGRLVKSVFMESQRERLIPLLAMALLYMFAYYMLVHLQVPALIKSYMLATNITILLTLFLSFRFHISLHMVGVGGLLGAVTGLGIRLSINMTLVTMIVLLVCGLVGSARLKLDAHKPAAVYSGFGLGIVVMMGGLLLLWRYHLPG
jgi:hypothetical protein